MKLNSSICSPSSRPPLRWIERGALILVALALASTDAKAQPTSSDVDSDLFRRESLLGESPWLKTASARWGVDVEAVYTADLVANVDGGIARKRGFLGNLDATLTWDTETAFDADFGTFFLYGLLTHGERPSSFVGDLQAVDNIEARDSINLFEAWWQKALLDGDASILVGLYDVNSEFYAIDSAELFVHSSFGTGAAFGGSGVNGPSIFPTAGLGARFKIEPIEGFDLQVAIVEGEPGDPRRPKGPRIRFDSDEGALVVAELGYHRSATGRPDADEDATRGAHRRRVGRAWADHGDFIRVGVGVWAYTAKQPHVSRVDALGEPIRSRGHPGFYAIADFDADRLDPLHTGGLSGFVQLGFADGDTGPFDAYAGGGVVYEGLLPIRPDDEAGFGVAAAFAGDALRNAARADGRRAASAEIALEWTYRAALLGWLSAQADVQYVINPGALRDRPDAVIAAMRWVVHL